MSLSDAINEPAPFRHDGPDTMIQAAKKADKNIPSLRLKILEVIAEGTNVNSLGGFTDDEIEQILEKSHQSISSARRGLSKNGVVVDSGKRRPTRSGCDAIVWKVNPDSTD